MKHIKTFASQTLPKALLPFLAASYFSFKGGASSNAAFNSYQTNQWFKNPLGDLSFSMETLDFHDNYLQFIVLALIFNIMIKVITMTGSFLSKRLNGENSKKQFLPLSFSQGEAGLFSDNTQLSALKILQEVLIVLLKYTLAFCFYHILGFFIISLCSGSVLRPQLVLSQGTPSSLRVLEGAPKDTPPPPPTPVKLDGAPKDTPPPPPTPVKVAKKQLSALSLSVGSIASSINFDPYSIALSQDGKTAFASDQASGKLDIIDVSNRQAPNVIGTVSLVPVHSYTNKYLKLSADGQTLFVSGFQYLEIVDVSNIQSPKILSQKKDPHATDSRYEGMLPMLYQMSMAFSADGKTLFIGGLGLQIFDISDLSNPNLLYSTKTESSDMGDDVFPITTVAMAADGKTMFYADGTLEVLDVSDPVNRKTIGSYSSVSHPEGSIRSIILSQDKKTAFVTVAEVAETIIIEKLDVSDPTNPRKIRDYQQTVATAQGRTSVFVTATPSYSHIFLSFDLDDFVSQIYGFNLMTEEFMDTQKSLVGNADSMAFSADHKYLFTASKNLFQIVELNLEYPNSRTFSLSESLLNILEPEGCLSSMTLSADSKTLFVVNSCPYNNDKEPAFVIYNVTNASLPRVISSSPIKRMTDSSIKVSKDNKRAFIVAYFDIYVWDISDLSSPTLFGSFKHDNTEGWMGVEESIISSDGRYLIALNRLFGTSVTLKILDFFTPTAQKIPNEILPNAAAGARLTLSSDDKTLYLFAGGKFLAYDISDISSPVKLSEASFHTSGESEETEALGCSLSPDDKLLALSIKDGSLAKLHIYDVSVPGSPQFKGEFTRPNLMLDYYSSVPAISSDLTKVYLIQNSGILVVNITNPEKPKIAGIMSISKGVGAFTKLFLSANNKVAYLQTNQNQIKIVNLVTSYTVYLNQESFYLGVKYTGTVTLFGRPTGKGYIPLDQGEHKFLKTAILDIKITATEENTKQTLSPLPYWMTFDKENYGISIEAKKTRDLGVYTLYSAFSNKIPKSAFESVESIKNGTNTVEELITTLISMGYIDNELFITSNFGPIQNFYLPSLFNGEKAQIYALLKGYYVETCTTFDILPSLKLDSTQKKLAITSPSYNQYKIEIALEKSTNASHAMFVSRPYSPLVPVIFGEKTHLTLEGSQEEINHALQHIVVDLENRTACAGSITVNDNLNPTINRSFTDIVQYLEINTAPALNSDPQYNLQAQIDSHDLSTGTYFAFTLNPKTFLDNNTEHLTYELAMGDPKKKALEEVSDMLTGQTSIIDKNKAKPNWLSFSNLEFKGTPPEEFTGRDFTFVLVAKNEFKEKQVLFNVHIRISTGYLLKLAMKMGPYMLTLLGLLVSANKIYNILGKKYYKHPIDFFVKAGEEVNSKVIFPVLFTYEEAQESNHILKHLKHKIASEVNSASISDLHLALHFVDKRTQIMDKAKIIETITSTVNGLGLAEKKVLKITLNGSGLRRDLVHQLVINHLVTLHLLSGPEKNTFKIYNKIKDQWGDMIEWGVNGKFEVNQAAFERVLEAEGHLRPESKPSLLIMENGSPTLQSRKTFQQHLLETEYVKEYNEDLLKNALVGHAYFHQGMNIMAIRAQIHVKEKLGASPLKEFLKLDLEATNLNSRFNVDYGISCRFENDMLHFEGMPQENFIGRTLVVQITDIRLRILKEIWIHEKGSNLNENGRLTVGEGIARGQGYDAL